MQCRMECLRFGVKVHGAVELAAGWIVPGLAHGSGREKIGLFVEVTEYLAEDVIVAPLRRRQFICGQHNHYRGGHRDCCTVLEWM